jgi:tetratricopeptide (TPR) repeat protein
VGDLFRGLGQGDQARQAFGKSLAIRERLAQAEPDRADYQRDLSVSYNKMGDLFRGLGQGDQARQAFGKSLAIRERLAQAEPDRADYQRDLSVSYIKMGDLFRGLSGSVHQWTGCL